MKHSYVIGIGAALLVLLGILMNTTRPFSIGPIGVLLFFILLYFSIVCFVYILLFFLQQVAVRIVMGSWRTIIADTPALKMYYYASVLSLGPVMLLGIQSMGSVGILEAGLMLVFQVIALFYIYKRF